MELLTTAKRFKTLLHPVVNVTDDDIFADQLMHVQHAHLEVDRLFGGPEYANPTASFCDLHVMNDTHSDTGVAYVRKSCSMLPFDLQVTEKALWRALAEEGTKKDSYFLDERVSSETMVSRSYGQHSKAGSLYANVLGKQTYRKYVKDNCVMIMWKWVVDPIEVNETKFSGLRCHEIGWIVLRGVDFVDTKLGGSVAHIKASLRSTLLQSYSKMTMELQDDIADQELQVGALTDFVVNLHDTISEVCGKMVADVLLEEDWNLNGWLGNRMS
ncbi:unnamed protein product [Phytophthora lilii]|uniref:Unnamed protein product n=1 Tax=Phytophthora lilii TaxID=2077276 RepID=A0A9W6U152_9STRA|nr:unnamed protein product [Phytophthora lilii]